MPTEFGTSTTANYIYSIYADYIPTNVVGTTDVYAGNDTSTDRRAMPYTMTEDGILNSVSIYHNGGSGDMLLAVYSDDGSGYPEYKLAQSEETAVNSTAGWQTVELTDLVEVEAGETIWLAWVFESNPGVRTIDDSPNGGGRASSGESWAYGMPLDFGTSTLSTWKYAICANYTTEDQLSQVTLIGNPYMYTARRYDIETGLYYYRARYYNPYIGRFTQIDPAQQGMNWYAYCGNNSINCIDPSGCIAYSPISFEPIYEGKNAGFWFRCKLFEGELAVQDFNTISDCVNWLMDWTSIIGYGLGTGSTGGIAWFYDWDIDDINNLPGWLLSRSNKNPKNIRNFWYLMIVNQILPKLDIDPENPSAGKKYWFDYKRMSDSGYRVVDGKCKYYINLDNKYQIGEYASFFAGNIYWSSYMKNNHPSPQPRYTRFANDATITAILAHELQHGEDLIRCNLSGNIGALNSPYGKDWGQTNAIRTENTFKWYWRKLVYNLVPLELWENIYITPGCETFLLDEQTPYPWDIPSPPGT